MLFGFNVLFIDDVLWSFLSTILDGFLEGFYPIADFEGIAVFDANADFYANILEVLEDDNRCKFEFRGLSNFVNALYWLLLYSTRDVHGFGMYPDKR